MEAMVLDEVALSTVLALAGMVKLSSASGLSVAKPRGA